MRFVLAACCFVLPLASGCGSEDGSGGTTSTAASTGGGAPTGEGGAGSSTGADTGSGGSGTTCTYPAAPYGVSQDSTLDGTLAYDVLAPDKTFGTLLTMSDLHDCDGSRGINAVFIKISASWCAPCVQMAEEIEGLYQSSWQGKGIVVEELLVENIQGGPAAMADAVAWRNAVGGDAALYTGVDPSNTFQTAFFPFTSLVDPRTMQIVAQDSDTQFIDLAQVLQLADQNM